MLETYLTLHICDIFTIDNKDFHTLRFFYRALQQLILLKLEIDLI